MVILEIMSGRKVLDTLNSSANSLTDWIWTLALKMSEGDIGIPLLPDRPIQEESGRGEGYGWCGGAEERLAKIKGHLASMAEAWADAMMRGEGERVWRRLYCADMGSELGCLVYVSEGGQGGDETIELRGAGRK
ncbi:unnamed protein product [Sphenostylis stenocarpa]|uniref:Uncharacterized protein n=1 Tax=Sphenostylis stenocarpa TaxID=92480 RepID=A0AA86RRE6_9FABA|nr:unnamed protein product [Sphenostylis stenocarpa]